MAGGPSTSERVKDASRAGRGPHRIKKQVAGSLDMPAKDRDAAWVS